MARKFAVKTVLSYSYSGDDSKAHDNGMMTKTNHLKGLLAVMNATNPGWFYPAIVSATGFSLFDIVDKEARDIACEIWSKSKILTTLNNPGHQVGAFVCIRQGLLACRALGATYMISYGDDIIPTYVDDADRRLNRICEQGADWSSTKFADNCQINTQVFICKVDSLLPYINLGCFSRKISQSLINGTEYCLEQYLFEAMTEAGLKIDINGGGQDYGHVHDPIRLLKELEKFQ